MSSLMRMDKKRTALAAGLKGGENCISVKRRKLHIDESDETTYDESSYAYSETMSTLIMPDLESPTDEDEDDTRMVFGGNDLFINTEETSLFESTVNVIKKEAFDETAVNQTKGEILNYLNETIVGDKDCAYDIGEYVQNKHNLFTLFCDYDDDFLEHCLLELAKEDDIIYSGGSYIKVIGEPTDIDHILIKKKLKIKYKLFKEYTMNEYDLKCKKIIIDVTETNDDEDDDNKDHHPKIRSINDSVLGALHISYEKWGILMMNLKKIEIIHPNYGFQHYGKEFYNDEGVENIIAQIKEIRDKRAAIKNIKTLALMKQQHVEKLMDLETDSFWIDCKLKEVIIYGWKVWKISIRRMKI